MSTSRIAGVDLARGLAVVLMIQTHAYDGWVRPHERAGFAFQLTRLLGSLPLPLFLSLAGLSLGLQVRRAADAGTAPRVLRGQLLRSGARVLAWGYVLNLLFALMDGARGLTTLLRFDVLHAIGASCMVLALCVGVGGAQIDMRGFAHRSLAIAGLALLACPLLTPHGHAAQGPLRYAWAPFVEVPGLSAMPLAPLAFFAGLYAAVGSWWWPSVGRSAPFALCVAAILVGRLTSQALAARGIAVSRQTVGIWFNALDYAGRAGLLTLLMVRLAPAWKSARDSTLARLGRHSLLLYAVHLPFCYGLFARPFKRALGMASASLGLLALLAGCAGMAWWRSQRPKAQPAKA